MDPDNGRVCDRYSDHTRFALTYTAVNDGESPDLHSAVPYNKGNVARYRTALYFALATLLLAAPSMTFAASAGFFGPVIPQSGSCFCNGGPLDWGCMLQVIQNLVRLTVSLGVILCVVWIAFAGFSLIVSRGNPEALSTAKTRILNSLIGIVVILCSWLVVDFVMQALYNPDAAFSGQNIGPWNDILAGSGSDYCIQTTIPGNITLGQLTTGTPSNGSTDATGASFVTGTGTGSCNPQTVAAAAAAGGYQLSAAQANALACIAKPESTCGTNTTGARTQSGAYTSAGGPWQDIMGSPDKCHSLNIPACGNLNCSAAFYKGVAKSDPASQKLAAQCHAAVNTLTCAAASAACLIQANGGSFSAWTSDPRSAAQKQCITSNGLRY